METDKDCERIGGCLGEGCPHKEERDWWEVVSKEPARRKDGSIEVGVFKITYGDGKVQYVGEG